MDFQSPDPVVNILDNIRGLLRLVHNQDLDSDGVKAALVALLDEPLMKDIMEKYRDVAQAALPSEIHIHIHEAIKPFAPVPPYRLDTSQTMPTIPYPVMPPMNITVEPFSTQRWVTMNDRGVVNPEGIDVKNFDDASEGYDIGAAAIETLVRNANNHK